jgi:hypothetical protein
VPSAWKLIRSWSGKRLVIASLGSIVKSDRAISLERLVATLDQMPMTSFSRPLSTPERLVMLLKFEGYGDLSPSSCIALEILIPFPIGQSRALRTAGVSLVGVAGSRCAPSVARHPAQQLVFRRG